MPWRRQAALERVRDPGLRVDVDLVDDRARDLDAVRREERGVEHDLVDRPADATLGDDHRRRAEHRGHDRVREADDRADAGVPGPLDQQDVVVGEGAVRCEDPRAEVLDDIARDVRLREAARDVDRAHLGVRLGQVEDRS